MFPQFEFPRCTPVFFPSYFFSVLKPLLKTTNLRIHKGLGNQILTSKNLRVNFSSVLGYTRFQQSPDYKKRRFILA